MSPLTLSLAFALAQPPAVDFGRDVLPILTDTCFHCHGPDPATRKAGLRLDTEEGAFAKKKNRAMIVPGKSAESEVVRRALSDDPDEVMPPPDSARKLTAKQKATLKAWVDQGAKWGRHWAFVPLPKDVPVPTAGHPIDGFVSAKLKAEGLALSPAAPRETWLRRVSLDLTGLPPTPAEVDAFLADQSPDAFGKQVDRLLASPRYGERMAADWLDLARYADTHGYQKDRFRPMWPYRDWAIRAFNANQPFDQFLTDQLAGDLLPNPTKDQRLATAFNRLHMQNEEGGIVPEEFRVAYAVDRVNTMGTAFLGLTFECCRCHDHKYDPLAQREFYSLFALFQNIDESGQPPQFTRAMPVPTLLLSTDAQDRELSERAKRIKTLETELAAERERAKPAFERWLKASRLAPEMPGPVAAYPFETWWRSSTANAVDSRHLGVGSDDPERVPGKVGRGARLDGENGFTFPGVGHFSRTDPFTLALWLNPAERVPQAVVLHHTRAAVDAGNRGYEVLLENGRVAVGLHHMWPRNALKVVTKAVVPVNAWTHLAVTYDGSSRAAGVRVYLDGKPVETEVLRDGLWKDIAHGPDDERSPDLTLGFRFRDAGLRGGTVDELRVYGRALTPLEVADVAGRDDLRSAWRTPTEKLTAEQRAGLFDYFFAVEHEPGASAAAALREARAEQNRLVTPITEASVMEELPTPKAAFVLKRGAYDSPGEKVSPDVPAALPAWPAGEPRNRLGLARWLTHPDHPLTARVAANRLWQQMFGRGLVETSDNFGRTGTPPTHPELLDWLARDLVAHGWDVKRALKQIALSDTYRQSAKVTPDLLAKDPTNQLLARFPARRLTAEMLRDHALFVGGLLVEKCGGPSVFPYQPEGLWDEAMGRPPYPRSTGDDLYRRGLYTVWKRTAPHPQMTTFDAADRSVCTARRQSTATPLQALALLNDPQIVEAARFLGQRMLKEKATTADRAAWAFRTVTARTPTAKELAVLVALFDEQKAGFTKAPKEAAKLLAVGDTAADPKLDAAELAAATVLGLAILNHDEAVNSR